MIANKWYCIAQTGTFDSGCTINVSFDSYVIQFSASVKYGSSAINITRCELPLSANLSLRLRESNGLWSVDLLSNNDITPEIVVADSPYWVAVNSVAGAGNIILTIKDISKDFNTETGGSGGGLDENELRDFLDKYGYTRARDFWKYETTGGGAIHTDYHIIVDGGGAFGGAELGGGGGISEFYIQLGEGGQKYKLGNSGLPNVVQIPKYPVVPTNVSEFYNDAGYIGGEQAALIFSRISEIEGRVEKLEKLWWVDENGNLHTTYNIVVEGGGAFGTGASVDTGGSGGLGRVVLVNDSGNEFASDENGIVRIPDYVNKVWFDAQNFASQSWVLSKGYVSDSALTPIREDITTLKKDVADLKGMWTIKDGKLYTTYSIVVEGGGAFGQGASDSGEVGIGKTILITPSGLRYETNDDGYVPIPEWASQDWVNGKGFATQTWVLNKGFLTENSADLLYAKRAELDDINETLAKLAKMWRLEDGKLFTDYSIVVKGGGAFGEGANLDSGESGGIGKVIIYIDGKPNPFETDSNGIVTLPAYPVVPRDLGDFTNYAGYIKDSSLNPIRDSINILTEDVSSIKADVTTVKSDVKGLKDNVTTLMGMWEIRDGKLYTNYSIVVKGGGAFGEGAESGGGSAGGLGQIIIRNQAGQEYKTDANGVVVIPTYLTSTALDGYATQQWVESKKYLTSIPAEYITETELTAKGYAIASEIAKTYATIEALNTTNTNLATVTTGLANVATTVDALSKNFVNGIAKEAAKVSHALTFGSKTYDGSIARTILASDLDAVTLSGEQTITGTKTFSSLITANGGIKIPYTASLKIGDVTLVEDNGALKILGNLIVTGGGEGFSKIIIQTESGQSYTTNDAGVVTIPNYITSAALNGYATQSWVTSQKYLTGITSAMVTTALGYVPFNSTSFTKATIKSTLGIADWALAASKPSYSWSEITGKPTFATVATSGKYNDLSGVPTSLPASDVYAWAKKATLALADVPDLSSKYATVGVVGTSKFLTIPSGGYIFTRGGFDWNVTNGDWSASYKILHEGNYADTTDKRYLRLSGGTISASSIEPLKLNNTVANSSCYIPFSTNGVVKAYVGWSINGYAFLQGPNNNYIAIQADGANYNGNTLIHSGNIGSQSVNYASSAGNVLFDKDVTKLYKGQNLNDYKKGLYGYSDANNPTNSYGDNTAVFAFQSVRGIDTWQISYNGSGIQNADGPAFAIRGNFANQGWTGWYQIAKTSSNVASATKLQTARTLWGQSFDGTGNVSGHVVGSNFLIMDRAANPYIRLEENGLYGYVQFQNGSVFIGPTSSYSLLVNQNGNVLIGTTTDSGYKLDVAGIVSIGTSSSCVFNMSRTSLNYFTTPANGYFGFVTNGKTISTANSDLVIQPSFVIPGATGIVYLGSDNYRWKVIYGQQINLSSNATIGGNLTVTGGGAFGSDIRYKDITSYKQLDLETIVNAPLFTFKWTDREDKKVYLGTSAQYWLGTQFKDTVDITNPKFYHLDYGALAVGIGISVAREVKGVKTDIKGVKTEVEQLRDEVKQLKEKLNKYETLWHN